MAKLDWKLGILTAILLSLNVAKSQDATILPVHPGDTVKFEVKFDGPDAGKVKSIWIYLGTKDGRPPTNQPGFEVGFRGSTTSPVAPNVFRPEIQIPESAANGDYIVYANASFEPGMIQYASGKEFETLTIRVENPKTIIPPSIKVKELP